MSNLSNPFVSVIIPVYNDPERIKICLQALENQTYPKNLYEVIVVDNGSNESIEPIVNQFGQAVASSESRVGSYAARNKGITLAKGEIIAFTDADCIPSSDWIEKGVKNLLSVPNCGLVAGKVELFGQNTELTALEFYESTGWWRSQKEAIEGHRYGATANLFTFKSVIDRIGSFDDTLKSYGDIEWGQRLYGFGYKQVYAEDTYVYHPLRGSLKEFSKKIVRLMGGEIDTKKKNGYRWKEFLRDLANDLKLPLRYYFSIRKEQNLKGNLQKIQYILIYTYIKYLRAGERIRLQLKGSSRRG